MINTKDILKMAKATLRHDQGYPERRLIHPHREWLIGMSMFMVLLLSGSTAAGLLFLHYQNLGADIVPSEQRIPNYQSVTVSDVLSVYANRTATFTTLQTTNDVVPSVEMESATTSASTTPDEVATSTATDMNVSEDTETEEESDTETSNEDSATSTLSL